MLVIHVNTEVVFQVVPDAAVAFIRMLHMYLFYLFRDLLVFLAALAQLARKPCVIGRARNMEVGTSELYRVTIFLVALLNAVVLPALSYLPKVPLLSISFIFLTGGSPFLPCEVGAPAVRF